jgi:serine/threonine protein kinase
MMSTSGAPQTGKPDPLLGQVLLERYRILRKVEERNGGGVYAAQHLLEARTLTIEVIGAGHTRPAAVDRFLDEARTVARVGHENVVEIFNGGRSNAGSVFLAMETLEGADLAQTLRTDAPMLWDRAQGIALQITGALAAVHRHGVVHGDLKPENILLVPSQGRRDFVKLLDFGVARVLASGADTGEGSLGGAPAYMAPEQADPTTRPDPRADVYALGCVLYHMVTGRPPFVADSVVELLAKHEGEVPAPPSSLRPAGTLPADLDVVLLRALEKSPENRWPDMAAFGEALSRCRLTRRQSVRVEALSIAELAGKTDAFEKDARRRSRKWAIVSVAAAVVIAIVAIRAVQSTPGHVRIVTVPEDATLSFDGLPVEARSPVVLDAAPGRYPLIVSRPGYATVQRAVDVKAGLTTEVPVELAAVPAAAEAAAAAPAP